VAEAAVVRFPPTTGIEPEPSPAPLPIWKRLALILRGLPEPKTSPANLPSYPNAGLTLLGTQAPLQWQSSATTYRMWSLTPWVRAAIKIRREQIAAADWDIVQFDREGRQSKALSRRIRNLLESPNARQDSFHSFAQELLEDILVLDGAAAEKVRYPSGELAQIWPTPGEFIAVDPRWDGSGAPDAKRYFYIPDGQVRASFRNEDMLYMMDNPRTISAIGISPIEVLKTVVDSELANQHYNRRQVLGAAPDGVLNIGESALPEDVAKAKGEWNQRVAEGGAVQIIGGYKSPSWMAFRTSNKDMQFREWEDLLLRCIAVVYGLSPMDLGITFDVNRSSAEQQATNTEDRGLRPLLDLFQRYLTRNIVWDESFGGKENNLKFAFSAINLNETKQKADINKIAVGGTAWKTVNEARIMDGRAPFGALDDENNIFNHILLMTPKGLLDLTKQEYVGEEQLAKLAADAQTVAATADANAKVAPRNEGSSDA
jgi:phage portal protein BeeE